MNDNTQRTIMTIGKIILALFITGVLGVGFFCGGVLFASSSDSWAVAFIIWGIGIVLWLAIMWAIFRKRKSSSLSASYQGSSPVVNKYQKALADYIVQARAAHLIDQAIAENLLSAGWAQADIDYGFDAVGGRKSFLGNVISGA